MFNHCYNCHIDFEHNLRIKGLWGEYTKNIINTDLDGIINDFESWVDDQIQENNTSYITEAGDVENWVGSNKSLLLKSKEETVKYLQSLKKD
jgi:hypothetical protein